jgi:hypothetical protein
MKKILIGLFLLSNHFAVFSQEEDNNASVSSALGVWQEKTAYFTLVSDANLRDKPMTQSTVITKLPIATKIYVESVSTDSFTINGYKAPWCKVSLKDNGKNITGYLWGGFISTLAKESVVTEGVVYLIGVQSWDEKKHRMALQVRVAQNNKEISKIDLNVAGDLTYSVFLKTQNPYSLKNVKEVLSLETGYEACGYPWTNDLIFWTGQKLIPCLQTSSMSDAGAFYSSQDYILPFEKGGIANHVILSEDQAEYEEKGNDLIPINQKYKLTLFKWNGLKLEKVKLN